MSLTRFADELSTDSPAPGGGSVAALCGSLAGSLTAMVAALTHAKKGMEDKREAMESLGVEAQTLKDWFMEAVDRDTAAFNQVLAAIRLPKKTDEDRAVRETAMEAANIAATTVPLEVLEQSAKSLELALQAVTEGNPNSVTDAGVAAACATAAARGASLNVRINLPGLGDEVRSQLLARHDIALELADSLGSEVAAAVDSALAG
jgi:glutamate formiminotransferase/formiminotetrahydrofolate cyclodeaminase